NIVAAEAPANRQIVTEVQHVPCVVERSEHAAVLSHDRADLRIADVLEEWRTTERGASEPGDVVRLLCSARKLFAPACVDSPRKAVDVVLLLRDTERNDIVRRTSRDGEADPRRVVGCHV